MRGASIDPPGYDAGKKIKGKKRHVLVDTQSLLLHAIIPDVQDRGGGVLVMSTLFGLYPSLLKLYADGGYQGAQFQQGLKRVCLEAVVAPTSPRCPTFLSPLDIHVPLRVTRQRMGAGRAGKPNEMAAALRSMLDARS